MTMTTQPGTPDAVTALVNYERLMAALVWKAFPEGKSIELAILEAR
jgi:hypothetical protein